MNIKMPLVILLLLLVVIFTLQNSEQVNINFLFWHVTLSRALMLFLVLAVGLLAGWIFATIGQKKNLPPEKSLLHTESDKET